MSESKEKKSVLEEQDAELRRRDSSEDGRLNRLLQERDQLSEELRRLEEEARDREDGSQPGSPHSLMSEEAMSPSASRNVSVISYNTTVGNVFKTIQTPDFLRPKPRYEPRTEAETRFTGVRLTMGSVIKASSSRAGDQFCHQPSHRLNVDFSRTQVIKASPWSQQHAADKPLPASSHLPSQAAVSQLHSAFSSIPRPTEGPFSVKPSAAPAWHPGLARIQKPTVAPVPKPFSALPVRPVPAPKPASVLYPFPPTTSTPKHPKMAPSIPKPMLPRPPFLANKFTIFS